MQGYPTWIQPSETEYCTVPHCTAWGEQERPFATVLTDGHRPRPAIPDSDICKHHEAELARLLRDLVADLRDLRTAILKVAPARADRSAEQTTAGGNDRAAHPSTIRSSNPHPTDVGARWNPAATPVIQQITLWADFLVRTIINERVLAPGDRHGLTEGMPTDVALAAIAIHHATWLARYPTLGPDLLREGHDLARRAHAALAVDPVQRVVVRTPAGEEIRCSTPVLETDLGPVLCEAPLVAIIKSEADARPSVIVCSADPGHASYPQSRWHELNLGTGRQSSAPAARDFVSIEVAATALGVSTKRAYSIATVEQWEKAGTRPEQYLLSDITRTAQHRQHP